MSNATMTDGLTPVASDERVELIDILRGFALLGILVVNFWGSGGEAARTLDRFLSELFEIFVSSSFYPLFSFLFGLGFAIQLQRASAKGQGVLLLYLRRMLALFLIGAFHAIVIWGGDILVTYSILGLLLIPLHRLSNRALLALAVIPLLLGLWGWKVRPFVDRIGGEPAIERAAQNEFAANVRAQQAGALAERFEHDPSATRMDAFKSAVMSRWHGFQRTLRRLFSRQALLNDIPAFFLIGFVVGRRRILQEASKYRSGLRIVAGIALLAAVVGNLVHYLLKPESRFLDSLSWTFSDYGMTAFYIAAISLGVTFRPGFARVFRGLAPAGRIGLTNYLLQSITMTVLFSHYGAALTAPTTAIWLVINLVFYFGVQLPFSRWWIRHYRFGPAEWLWRSMTYGRPQPMRLATDDGLRAAGGVAAG